MELAEHTQEIPVIEGTEDFPEESFDNSRYLALARSAFEESDTFLDAGHKERWRRNYSLSQSEHPEGSKYLKDSAKHRSKTFRGKTEASVRKNEAAVAVAMFSNRDVVNITAENPDDESQEMAADAVHKLVNYHLDDHVPWFLTVVGSYHEAMIAGDVVSEQYWNYKNTDDGAKIDWPAVDLHPLEHVHVSPHADWRDPINSSPYFIIEMPMFIGDIKERMGEDWIEYGDSEIQTAAIDYKHNSVQQSRAGEEQLANTDQTSAVTEFDVVFVHKNFIRTEGEELFYYTLGTSLLLSEPVSLQEAYPHIEDGKRPFIWGTATIEPHKVYRRSLVDRVAGTQAQSNDIANQRFDNVRQVLNKRKYVKRGMGVDYSTLLRNVSGGIILMDELDSVREEDTSDITGSSYQEQHMINADFDELAGSFSNSSVTTNRQLNDTVGGMQLLKGDSNTLTEYQLRVFVETWAEPVVGQLVDMIQFYEDDDVIQQVTQEQLTHEDLQVPIKTRVSVGFGSTDPEQKIQKLVFGVQAVTNLFPQLAERLDSSEVAKEIFGALGFNDGKKFLPDEEQEDPRIAQMTKQIQKMQQYIETDQAKINGNLQGIEMKGENDLQGIHLKGKMSMAELIAKLAAERQIKFTDMALTRGIKVKELEQKTGTDAEKLNLDFLKEVNRRLDIDTKQKELNYKIKTGNQGI